MMMDLKRPTDFLEPRPLPGRVEKIRAHAHALGEFLLALAEHGTIVPGDDHGDHSPWWGTEKALKEITLVISGQMSGKTVSEVLGVQRRDFWDLVGRSDLAY